MGTFTILQAAWQNSSSSETAAVSIIQMLNSDVCHPTGNRIQQAAAQRTITPLPPPKNLWHPARLNRLPTRRQHEVSPSKQSLDSSLSVAL